MSLNTQQLRAVTNFRFQQELGIPESAQLSFSMLGQGEYNINYLFTHPVTGQKLVLRKNTGSQMHLSDQIGYEYHALRLLRHSGRTPQPYFVDSQHQMLVMEYLPGRALDYRTDLRLAAECLAQIHAVPVSSDCRLLRPQDPVQAMLNECRQMAGVYLRSQQAPMKTKQQLVRLLDAAEKRRRTQQEMPRCIINTELNSGNFLINGAGKPNYLIDWEKPLIGEAAQDLGHFLAPTTTYWKTDVRLSKEEKEQFLRDYHTASGRKDDFDQLQSRTAMYETMTCLRGISWCAMAWVEYQDPTRPIQNHGTYQKILEYLTEDFLGWIWKNYFA